MRLEYSACPLFLRHLRGTPEVLRKKVKRGRAEWLYFNKRGCAERYAQKPQDSQKKVIVPQTKTICRMTLSQKKVI